jgi:hypothetical protein
MQQGGSPERARSAKEKKGSRSNDSDIKVSTAVTREDNT